MALYSEKSELLLKTIRIYIIMRKSCIVNLINEKHRHLLALLLCFVMTVSLFAGYSETKATSEETTQSEEQTETQETGETREITDMAGRKVTVPAAEDIESVFSTGPVAAIFMYMVAPDKLLGWNYELNDVEKSIILEKYHDLPNFGMGDAINYEAVIAANPTIALNCGKIKIKRKTVE